MFEYDPTQSQETESMEAQELFDKVTNHLLTQDKRSYDEERHCCVYRHPDGVLRCAVGGVIPDEMYQPWMDSLTPEPGYAAVQTHGGVSVFHVMQVTPELAAYLGTDNQDLLDNLQTLHDSRAVSSWPDELRAYAERNGLTYNGSR